MKRHTLFAIISILAILMSYIVIAGCNNEENEYYCLESCIDRCGINETTEQGYQGCLDDCDSECAEPDTCA